MAWGSGNLGGSAAGGLNIKIIASDTRPAAPNDNRKVLVWAKTSAKIPTWAITNITPSAPSEGMLQIKTAESGTTADLLIKNDLIVHITGLRQYLNGKWETIAGGLWASGKWTLFSALPYLYDRGTEFTDRTGPLTARALKYAPAYAAVSPEINKGKTNMTISIPGVPTNTYGLAYYSKDIDLTPYKSLKAVLKRNKAKVASMPERFASIGIYKPQAEIDWSGTKSKAIVAEATPAMENTKSTVSIDLTNINGPHVIGYWVGDDGTLEIHQAWLEPK